MLQSSSNRTCEKDRVALQCYHNEELQMKGETTMPDQGIVFGKRQKPREMRPGQKIKNNENENINHVPLSLGGLLL